MAMSARKTPPPARKKWLKLWMWWLIACSYGWGIGWIFGLVGILVGGSVIGQAQWVVLRRHIDGIKVWAVATGVSLGFSLPISLLLLRAETPAMGAMAGAMAGAITGFTQARILEGHVIRTDWWILSSIIGLAGGLYAGITMFREVWGSSFGTIPNSVVGVTIGLVYGAVTGTMLLWLLWMREQQNPPQA
jgi:hypothetical protein